MKSFIRVALVVLCAVTGAVLAHDHGLTLTGSWIREAPPRVRMMAGYLRIENHSQSTRVLQGARSDSFKSVEIHRTTIEAGVARMRHVPRLELEAGQQVVLEPGGMHLMLMGPLKPLKAGDRVEIELDLGADGKLAVQFPVQRRGD